jgi:hypothetical protein
VAFACRSFDDVLVVAAGACMLGEFGPQGGFMTVVAPTMSPTPAVTVGRLDAGLRSGPLLGIPLEAKIVAKIPLNEAAGVTSLRQLYASKLISGDDVPSQFAYALIDGGDGQALVGQLHLSRAGANEFMTVDHPFGDEDVTGVPPQAQTGAAIRQDRSAERRDGKPWYARAYGDGLSIQRTNPALERIIGWDHYVSFDNGNTGTLN